jgi:hypothetical protein
MLASYICEDGTRVSLDGIIGCGRTSFETVIMLFTALKKT